MEIKSESQIYESFELQRRNDLETLFAECIDGSMRTPFEYSYDANKDKLFARDGSDIDKIFDDSYVDICKVVEENPNAEFDKRRVAKELGERDDMYAMVKGELPNTMVVVSDFPEELQDYPSNYRGYNISRKQTMLRIVVKNGSSLVMYSQSLDLSDRRGLEAIYGYLGFEAKSGELLGQRMHLELESKRQQSLIDELQNTYDQELMRRTGKLYNAGIEVNSDERIINTYDFVRSQKDLVGLAVAEVLGFNFNSDKLYSTIAALQYRYEGMKKKNQPSSILSIPKTPAQASLLYYSIDMERQRASQEARREGKTFSACGLTIDVGELSSVEELSGLGYIAAVSPVEAGPEEKDWSYDLTDYCRECQAPPEKNEKKKKVGPCRICEHCVNKKHGGKK